MSRGGVSWDRVARPVVARGRVAEVDLLGDAQSPLLSVLWSVAEEVAHLAARSLGAAATLVSGAAHEIPATHSEAVAEVIRRGAGRGAPGASMASPEREDPHS
jgi:hypothetical protein